MKCLLKFFMLLEVKNISLRGEVKSELLLYKI